MSMSKASSATQNHQHGPACGHTAVKHDGYVDYLRDGHLQHEEGGKGTEDVLPVSQVNPDACTPNHKCSGHAQRNQHGPDCGHEAVPHGDHVDYLVDGHLHHPHGDHCDN